MVRTELPIYFSLSTTLYHSYILMCPFKACIFQRVHAQFHDIVIYSYIMEGFLAEFHGMEISLYIMEKFFAGFHDIGTFMHTMEIFLLGLHDTETFPYIMENLLPLFHGMERFPYTMEIFFISCLRKNASAVLLKYLKVRTALCYRLEQFYQQICQFLLLV